MSVNYRAALAGLFVQVLKLCPPVVINEEPCDTCLDFSHSAVV